MFMVFYVSLLIYHCTNILKNYLTNVLSKKEVYYFWSAESSYKVFYEKRIRRHIKKTNFNNIKIINRHGYSYTAIAQK